MNQKSAQNSGISGFPARLKSLIGEESLRSFSRKLGMSDTGLRAYLSGKTSPTLEKLIQISEVTGADISWLATGETQKEAKQEQVDEVKTEYRPSMQTQKIMELIDTLEPDYRREILLRIEALHQAKRNTQQLKELQAQVEKLLKKMG